MKIKAKEIEKKKGCLKKQPVKTTMRYYTDFLKPALLMPF